MYRAGILFFAGLVILCAVLAIPNIDHGVEETYTVTPRTKVSLYWPADEQEGRININTADAKELQKLYGIGQVLSQAIVDFREQKAPFYFREDLLFVKGIGPKRLAAIYDDIYVIREGAK